MADRNNTNDIFNIVKEDFNWIVEDITQHKSLTSITVKNIL